METTNNNLNYAINTQNIKNLFSETLIDSSIQLKSKTKY